MLLFFQKHIILICLLALYSCDYTYNKSNEVPSEVLSEEKMAAILCDLTLMQSSIDQNQINSIFNDTILTFNIYKQHKVSRLEYELSLKYYAAHPDQFKAVYKRVAANLQVLKSKN